MDSTDAVSTPNSFEVLQSVVLTMEMHPLHTKLQQEVLVCLLQPLHCCWRETKCRCYLSSLRH